MSEKPVKDKRGGSSRKWQEPSYHNDVLTVQKERRRKEAWSHRAVQFQEMFCQPKESLQGKVIFLRFSRLLELTFFGTLTIVGHWLRAALWEYGPRSKRIVAGLVHQLCSHSMKPGQFFLVAISC